MVALDPGGGPDDDQFDQLARGALTVRVRTALACGAATLLLAACASAAPSTSPYPTAEDACRASSGGDGSWTVVVRADRPALADRASGTVLVMQPGQADGNVGACITYRTSDGSGFGDTTFAIGKFPPATPQPLTYASAVQSQDQSPEILLGRVPPSAASVRLTFGDGTTQPGHIGSGFWVAWLEAPADPVAVEALDASGAVVGRIADPKGVQPGA